MRKAFVIVSTLLLVSFVLQFVFAAVGAFTKPAGDGAYALHSVNGMAVIPVLTLLTTLFAALARAPGRLVGLAILPIGLVVVQALIAMLANGSTDAAGASTPFGLTIAGLHAIIGIVAVHVAVGVAQAARKLSRPAPAGATPVPVRAGEPA
ncbi:hypothetical protein DKT68_29310 [Micromonospora acroterricola]|uniref:Cytochrome b561 n=1 Tax=Micromonospora acroterricola TaxID=2202421 RepID=A0A317CXI2_9ACTN|nr:DUF6220 domain-containing protein [Micromonospora acroterricola]PWR04965.1 hypothetical protein DKT68_29310 [Micromonospora acroterricola]